MTHEHDDPQQFLTGFVDPALRDGKRQSQVIATQRPL